MPPWTVFFSLLFFCFSDSFKCIFSASGISSSNCLKVLGKHRRSFAHSRKATAIGKEGISTVLSVGSTSSTNHLEAFVQKFETVWKIVTPNNIKHLVIITLYNGD